MFFKDFFQTHGRSFISFRLTLSLLVLRVLADYNDFAMSLDDLAFFADRLNGSSYFHSYPPLQRLNYFPVVPVLTSVSPDDSSLCEVIRGKFDFHLITRKDPDVIHSDFA